MKLLLVWVAMILAVSLPSPAWASGMYLPWYAETLFFLIGTPTGWIVLTGILAVIVVAVIKITKRKK